MDPKKLLEVYQRASNRITSGMESFETIMKLFEKRAEVEVKIANLITDIIPKKPNPQDVLLNNIIFEMENEAKQHMKLQNDFNLLIFRSTNKFAATQAENRKDIEKNLNRQIKELSKAIRDMDNAKAEFDEQKNAIDTVKPEKRENQMKKAKKAEEDYIKKRKFCEEVSDRSEKTQLDMIKASFSDFDSNRLDRLQNNACAYAQLKGRLGAVTKELADRLNQKGERFDAKDRAARFSKHAFDPNSKSVDEGADLIAIAINDFRSDEPQDLQFERGDEIKVIEQHSSGWWVGDCNNKRGTFPVSFVTVPEKQVRKELYIDADFVVVKQYTPRRNGEIELELGDVAYVEIIIGEWCKGMNLSTNKKGSFPLDSLAFSAN